MPELPPSRRPGFFDQVLSGAGCPLTGLRYLFGHPSLGLYIVIPTVVNVMLALFLMVLAYKLGLTWLMGIFNSMVPATGVLHYTLIAPAWFLAMVILLLLGVIGFLVFSQILAGPFNDLLSGKVEQLEGSQLPVAGSLSEAARLLGRSLVSELKKWALFFAIGALLLPLHLIPLLGSLLWTVLWGGVSLWFLGFEYSDYPMSRRHYAFADKLHHAWCYRGQMFGLGIGITVMLLIPLVQFFSIPFCVIGSTLLFLRTQTAPAPRDPAAAAAMGAAP